MKTVLKILFMCLWCHGPSSLDPLSESTSTFPDQVTIHPSQVIEDITHWEPIRAALTGRFISRPRYPLFFFFIPFILQLCLWDLRNVTAEHVVFIICKRLVYSNNQDMEFEASGITAVSVFNFLAS